jgi:hypothetical protein
VPKRKRSLVSITCMGRCWTEWIESIPRNLNTMRSWLVLVSSTSPSHRLTSLQSCTMWSSVLMRWPLVMKLMFVPPLLLTSLAHLSSHSVCLSLSLTYPLSLCLSLSLSVSLSLSIYPCLALSLSLSLSVSLSLSLYPSLSLSLSIYLSSVR